MFLAKRYPDSVRHAYKRDTMAGMMSAVMSGLTIPFFAVIARKDLHATGMQLGVIMIAPVAVHIFSFLWANMVEGKRKMPFVVTALAVSRGALCASLFATTANLFVLLVTAFWLGWSIAGPAYSALMKEIYPDSDRGRIMGYVRVPQYFIWIGVAAIAGPLLHIVSYRYVFPIAGLFGIAAALTFGSIPTSKESGNPNVNTIKFTIDAFRMLKKDAGYRWFCAGVFIAGWGDFLASTLYPMYQVDVLHVGTRWAAIFSMTTLTISTIAYFFWGPKIDRKNPIFVVLACNAIYIPVPLIYCISGSPWMLLPVMAIMGVVNAGTELGQCNGVLHFAPEDRIPQYQAIFAFLWA